MREANQLLVQKIQQRVDADAFAAFKRESGKFMRHEIDAGAYFHKVSHLCLQCIRARRRCSIGCICTGALPTHATPCRVPLVLKPPILGALPDQIAELGLVSLTAELASLCPEPQRRAELLDVYRTQSAVSTWVPPEVVEAATQQAQANATWRCSICTLINA